MKKFFNYIFTRSNWFLFLWGLFFSIFFTACIFYLPFKYPELIIKDLSGEFSFWKLTLIGKFLTISGIIPNFLFLILIFRLTRYIISTFLELLIRFFEILGSIIEVVFSPKNMNKLGKTISSNKPKLVKVIKKIKLKKKIEKDYLMPISIIIASTILAIAILFQ